MDAGRKVAAFMSKQRKRIANARFTSNINLCDIIQICLLTSKKLCVILQVLSLIHI